MADSGYFTNFNLYYIFINKINAIIIPKTISERKNNELRKKEGHKETRPNSNKKKYKRVKNGYKCQTGRFMRLVDSPFVKKNKNKEREKITKQILTHYFSVPLCFISERYTIYERPEIPKEYRTRRYSLKHIPAINVIKVINTHICE